ncbi:hypothetical protein FB45DRAFT_820193 [Roridomyces roridus]|uniref:FAD-binding domain-containing protein n=1 Tax=Roridomyces roridus TaxID=1738132 RepID=A0AAD7FYW8_9AGAR|nr:hypothetical protein FB45DRAFT_820193 [Roridomyces roridus]
MKIIVVGAGIGGLAVYHALRKHLADASPPVSLVVFEVTESMVSSSTAVGGALGLAPNGLGAISRISADAAAYIEEQGFAGEVVTFRNSRGRLLGRFRAGRKARYGIGGLMVPRSTVHEAFVQELRPGAVAWGSRVRYVKEFGDRVEVVLEDGTTETADVVIGADGAQSVVREAIFGDVYDARFENVTGVGGILPMSSLSDSLREKIHNDPVTVTFGANGFFGYSPVSSDPTDLKTAHLGWWSTYETDSTEPPTREAIREQLLARHTGWESSDIISLGCSDDVQILPTYTTPRLPHWTSLSGSGRILLLGDAAHPMPPSPSHAHVSSQGVTCAVQDAVAIALFLKHYRVSHRFGVEESLRRTARAYEGVRMKRVGRILDASSKIGAGRKKSWLQEKVRDWRIWILCKLPEAINDARLGYDVEVDIARYIKKSGCEPE